MKNQLTTSRDFFRAIKNTVFLYENKWREHTTMLLHGSREVDKTDKALEIVSKLSGQAVYINTSNAIDAHVDKLQSLDNLFVLTPEYESPDDMTDYADLVIGAIEEVMAKTEIRTFIIDSVSRIAALSFGKNASPAYVMKRLVSLQLRCKLTFLVISHDSTKAVDRALLNLADSELTLTDDDVAPVNTVEPLAADLPPASDEADHSPRTLQIQKQLSRRERRRLQRQGHMHAAV
ncbi:MAG: hypothetical protein K2K00_01320 [Muribaculaceae bacterium]|nr:hypothetical protein [Muribaculaceae bacterium]